MTDRAVIATLDGQPLQADFPMYATIFGMACVVVPEARYAALVERERLAELDTHTVSAAFDQAPPERQQEALGRVAMMQDLERLTVEVGPAEAVARVAREHGVTPQMVRRYRGRVAGRAPADWPIALLTRKGPLTAGTAERGLGRAARAA